jgi:hypothetical protein
VDGSRTFGGVGWDPHRTGSVLQGAGGCEATQPARHHRLKQMKHNLTLDHVKKEAGDLSYMDYNDETLRHLDDATRLTP